MHFRCSVLALRFRQSFLPSLSDHPRHTHTHMHTRARTHAYTHRYTWAQCNKDVIVSFYFGTSFPAMYLPWALLMFNILLGGSGMTELMGIACTPRLPPLPCILPSVHACIPARESPTQQRTC